MSEANVELEDGTAATAIEHRPGAITRIDPDGPALVAPWRAPSDAAQLFSVLAQVAMDPNADVGKLERIEAMYVRMKDREAKVAFDTALAEMQPKLPIIGRRGKIKITDKDQKNKPIQERDVIQATPYALWEDINEAITPILGSHGFTLSHRHGIVVGTPEQGGGRVFVTSILARGGHREETTITLPHDSTGSKNAVQAIGSSVAYGKRYNAVALLNITTKGEDDDATKGGAGPTLTEDQVTELQSAIVDVNVPIARVIALARSVALVDIERLEDIPQAHYDKILASVKQREKKPSEEKK